MARGNLDDFTSKWGFNDGECVEPRDYAARQIIVRGLNKLLKNHRALEFDRAGMHNSCIIVFAPAEIAGEETDVEKVSGYDWNLSGKYERAALDEISELQDSDGMEFDFDEFIGEAYYELEEAPPEECYGQAVVDRYLEMQNG